MELTPVGLFFWQEKGEQYRRSDGAWRIDFLAGGYD